MAQKKRERAAAQSSKAREMQKLYLVQAMAGPMAREGLNLHGKAWIYTIEILQRILYERLYIVSAKAQE